MVDAIATFPHFVDHLLPLWNALPVEQRGVFAARANAADHAARRGLQTVTRLPAPPRLTLVASHADYLEAHCQGGRPVAYVNHGVGQCWRDETGRLLERDVTKPRKGVRLFLTPGPHATHVTIEVNPNATVVEAGSAKVEALRLIPRPVEPLLVVSTHWQHKLVPESNTALPTYLSVIKESPIPVALHAHPRIAYWVRNEAQNLNLEFIETFDEVCQRATVYATDSSSTLFEFAALDRPVVVLNGLTYRRNHHHGLRFWEAATVGVNVNHPSEFATAVAHAIEDAPGQREQRAAAIAMAYHPFDGHAADRAVTALLHHA